jgi:hypothetical protein
VLVLAIVASSGCLEDVPTLYVSTTATISVELAPPDDQLPPSLGHYRWETVEAPPGVVTVDPTAETAMITIVPATRGIYVFDRWFVGQAVEQLSYHVVLSVDGAAPKANVIGPTTVTVGEAAMFDGSASASPEQRALAFQWRLASRPQSSTTGLAAADAVTLTFVPDVVGEYLIELRVFDGELWSPPAVVTLMAR